MPQMGPVWWFYLMLVFWSSWLMVSLSFFYWFSLSSLMALNSPLSVFFFFFFYYNKNELLFTSMNNKISLDNMMFFYLYDL
uniref:ATP synthase F0 subunit 8 n=1 Tax=Bemisia tabaci TaxID=7038 RepID=A0A345U690_BEMTA|nr:ATP synthase F0 subunit 8 [Bemisia tabaci]